MSNRDSGSTIRPSRSSRQLREAEALQRAREEEDEALPAHDRIQMEEARKKRETERRRQEAINQALQEEDAVFGGDNILGTSPAARIRNYGHDRVVPGGVFHPLHPGAQQRQGREPSEPPAPPQATSQRSGRSGRRRNDEGMWPQYAPPGDRAATFGGSEQPREATRSNTDPNSPFQPVARGFEKARQFFTKK